MPLAAALPTLKPQTVAAPDTARYQFPQPDPLGSPDNSLRLDFTYDYQGRRTEKKVSTWNSGSQLWTASSQLNYLYDGWNLVAEFSGVSGPSSLVLQRTYTWGLDLSGTAQGAGGVGGLLALTTYQSPTSSTTYSAAFDANGNLTGLIDSSDGTLAASYEYDPFGNTIKSTGPAAGANPFRFSTKYTDDESGLLYYGLRYYQSSSGRWLNRDPIDESGGLNLYGFVRNDVLSHIDTLGLVLAAFDGTDNDADRDRWDADKKINAPTNVKIMYDLYFGDAFYRNGVGTRTDITLGKLNGKGTGERVDDMLARIEKYLRNNPDEPVDIIGFSRGAASARIFANDLKKKIPCATIRFLGIFDTVSQMGVPNPVNYQFGYNLDVDTKSIGYTAHAVAADEHRSLFPLTSISTAYPSNWHQGGLYLNNELKEIKGPNYWEKPFSGVHSDLGGGYRDGRNMDALRWMIERGQAAGAPFLGLDDYIFEKQLMDSVRNPKVHDSRYPVLDRIPWTHIGSSYRRIFPGNINTR